MYRKTTQQMTLMGVETRLGRRGQERLGRTWAPGFRARVLPVLLSVEDGFAHLYADVGRPNWSVGKALGILLLQELMDLTDQEAVDMLSFDARWQHALDLSGDEAYLSRRSLVEFRTRMVRRDPEMALARGVFLAVGDAAIRDLGISVSRQRIDSTHVMSNIRQRGRLDLFREVLAGFVRRVRALGPELEARLPSELRAWFEKREKGEKDEKVERPDDTAEALHTLATWCLWCRQAFDSEDSVKSTEQYGLVCRLLDEHCEIVGDDGQEEDRPTPGAGGGTPGLPDPDPDLHGEGQGEGGSQGEGEPQRTSGAGGGAPGLPDPDPDLHGEGQGEGSSQGENQGEGEPQRKTQAEGAPRREGQGEGAPRPEGRARNGGTKVRVKSKPARPGTSLQSAFDPDAGYHHEKGVGYAAQVAETCGNLKRGEGFTEIITDFHIHSAGERDFAHLVPALDRLTEVGKKPEALVGDSHFVSGELLLDAERRGIDLQAPASRGQLPADVIGRDQFKFDEEGKLVECPQGHGPTGHTERTTSKERPKKQHAKVPAEACCNCPLAGRCVARPPNSGKGDWHVDIEPDLRARDANLARQRTEEWKQLYRMRSGIEATNSELKRRHGLGRLRVRGRPRVTLATAMKLTACNTKRWLKAAASR